MTQTVDFDDLGQGRFAHESGELPVPNQGEIFDDAAGALVIPSPADMRRYENDAQLIALSEMVLEKVKRDLAAGTSIDEIRDQRAKVKALDAYFQTTLQDRLAKLV